MKDSIRKIVMEVTIENKKIEIPFTTIEKLDHITTLFFGKEEIARLLFKDKHYPIKNIRIAYTYKKPGEDNVAINYLPIKYAYDNFDESDLYEKFSAYIKHNPKEIVKKDWGLIYIIENSRKKTGISGLVHDFEVENAIDKLWQKGYKTKRDIYFKLVEKGIEVKINPTNLFYGNPKYNPGKSKIAKFESDDSYFEYLKSLAEKGEEEEDYAIEQISMFDIDKMPTKNLANDGTKIFDGVDEEPENIKAILEEKIENLTKEQKQALIDRICYIRDTYPKRKIKCKN